VNVRNFGFSLVLTIFGLACQEPAGTPTAESAAQPLSLGHNSFVASDGVKITFSQHGDGERALVFIHGWSCDRSFWRKQIKAFSGEYTVLTIDLPGHGASGFEREDWTLPRYGQDVAEIVGDLGLEQVVLIGHSMGGPVALEAARLLPDETLGVIGVDALHNLQQKPSAEAWEGFMAPYEEDFIATCEQFVEAMFRPEADPALIGRVRSEMCDAPQEIAKALLRQFGTYDQAASASLVNAPLRSLNADLFPTDVESNREVAPEYEAVILPDTGHFLMLEKPDSFNRLLAEMVRDLEDRWIVVDR
jgi:pimeloyl-ACP methyl ester carboxylesterase